MRGSLSLCLNAECRARFRKAGRRAQSLELPRTFLARRRYRMGILAERGWNMRRQDFEILARHQAPMSLLTFALLTIIGIAGAGAIWMLS